uniref:Adenine DNA glycosylase n=1 Tax=Hydrogenovibrio crunogenus (strain DSM 25203 / XCL-2) TaxID=317025 RepID=Q31JF7_HYDCU
MSDLEEFSQTLLEWFDRSGRHDLPWQQNKTPYRVWVSEIMLQQTQVQTVIPYYERFMKAFPSVEALAQASQEEVLSHWSGLGYYARGRNLLKAAQIVVDELQGKFPQDLEGMMALPGIGRSTAGAVLSIASQQRHPILDGNVKRVLCRYDAVESWSGEKQTEAMLWQRANELTPEQRFDDYTQAIMDLGATLCTRSKPKCEACPVQKNCQAWRLDRVSDFPYPKPKKAKPTRETAMMIFLNENRQLFLQQRPQKGIWGGLWSLPEMPLDPLETLIKSKVETLCDERLNLIKWPLFKHTFSHYHLMIHPFFLDKVSSIKMEGEWFTVSEALTKGLPAPIRKLINQLENSND